MKKAIVLTGSDYSKKLKLTNLLAGERMVTVVRREDFDKKNNFWLNLVERDTEVLVFYHINIARDLEKFFEIITDGVTVKRTERSVAFTIFPLIIIDALTKTNYKEPEGGSIEQRFDFFNIDEK